MRLRRYLPLPFAMIAIGMGDGYLGCAGNVDETEMPRTTRTGGTTAATTGASIGAATEGATSASAAGKATGGATGSAGESTR